MEGMGQGGVFGRVQRGVEQGGYSTPGVDVSRARRRKVWSGVEEGRGDYGGKDSRQ